MLLCIFGNSLGVSFRWQGRSGNAREPRVGSPQFIMKPTHRMGLGWLWVALFCAVNVRGADVAAFGIIKSQQFVQTNDSAAVPLASSGFAFNAFVIATGFGAVTNATVKPSNATPLRPLAPLADGLGWLLDVRFDSSAALDAAYPNGTLFSPVSYALAMGTANDGLRSVSLGFTVFGFFAGYPPTAQVSNVVAAQAIDTTRDFTLGWSAAGAQAIDLVQVLIVDGASNVVYGSPAPFAPGALSSTSTSFVIPAGRLPAGTDLIGHVTLARPVTIPNTNAYPGAVGISAAARDTQFPIVTRPAPEPPRLQLLTEVGGGVRLRFPVETNRLYRLQRSLDLLSWSDVVTTNSTGGTVDVDESGTGSAARGFYRVRIGQ